MSPKAEEIKARLLAMLCVANRCDDPDYLRFNVYRSTEPNRETGCTVYKITGYMPYEYTEFPQKLDVSVSGDNEEQALERAEDCYLSSARRYAVDGLSVLVGGRVEYEDMQFVINALRLRMNQKTKDDE